MVAMSWIDKLSVRIKLSLIAVVGVVGVITYLGFANYLSNRSVQMVSQLQKKDILVLEYVDLIWPSYASVKSLLTKADLKTEEKEHLANEALLVGQYLGTIGKIDSTLSSKTNTLHFHFYQYFRKSQKLLDLAEYQNNPREIQILKSEIGDHLYEFETAYLKFSTSIYNQLKSELETIQKDNIELWRIGLSIGIATIIFLITFSYLMGSRISNALAFAIEVANRIQKNEWVDEINISAKDETGQLLRAIKNMHDGLKEVQRQLQADAGFAAALNKIDEDEIYENSLATIANALHLPACALYLLTQDQLECRCYHTLDGLNLSEEALNGNGFPTQVLLENRALKISSSNHKNGALSLESGLGAIELDSIYGWPVLFQNGPVGVLVSSHLTPMTDQQESYLHGCLNQLGIRIYSLNLDSQRKDLVEDLKQQSNELESASKNALEASQIKSDFLANMSHEIRTPMNSILGFTELALQTNLTSTQEDYLNKARSSCQALLGIVNDILDFSKIEANKIELENIPFNLHEELEKLTDLFAKQFADKKLDLLLYSDLDSPYLLKGDPLRISQIFINLISNALKFTNEGYVKIEYRLKGKENNRAEFLFSLEDTGIGIPKNQLANIFDAFTQADHSTTREFGGTGLGLSICKKFVDLMHGSIWVESDDHGTTFYFTLELELQEEQSTVINKEDFSDLQSIILVDTGRETSMLLEHYLDRLCPSVHIIDSKSQFDEYQKSSPEAIDIIFFGTTQPKSYAKEISTLPIAKNARKIHLAEFNEKPNNDAITLLTKPIKFSNLHRQLTTQEILKDRSISSTASMPEAAMNQHQDISGLTILVADDTELNRELAICILEDVDINVIEAVNGADAVEKFKEHADEIDLVIMDVQMPEMDGYEATIEIRKSPLGESVPIIAMTANALVGDDNKCLDSGMNDYLSKPASGEQIYGKISHWCQNKKQPNASENNATEKTNIPDTTQVILDVETALALVNGKASLYNRMLDNFFKHFSQVADEIQSMLDSGSQEDAARKAHSLKGVAGNIAAPELQRVAKQLEHDLNNNILDDVDALLLELRDAISDVKTEAKKIA